MYASLFFSLIDGNFSYVQEQSRSVFNIKQIASKSKDETPKVQNDQKSNDSYSDGAEDEPNLEETEHKNDDEESPFEYNKESQDEESEMDLEKFLQSSGKVETAKDPEVKKPKVLVHEKPVEPSSPLLYPHERKEAQILGHSLDTKMLNDEFYYIDLEKL